MTASIPYARKGPHIIDVMVKEVQNASPFRSILFIAVCLVALYGVASWFRIDFLVDENKALTAQRAGLNRQVSDLKGSLIGVDALRRDLATSRSDLKAEIARKNELAVENTRLKGRITQGERDLDAALQKLKAYEKPRAVQKKK